MVIDVLKINYSEFIPTCITDMINIISFRFRLIETKELIYYLFSADSIQVQENKELEELRGWLKLNEVERTFNIFQAIFNE